MWLPVATQSAAERNARVTEREREGEGSGDAAKRASERSRSQDKYFLTNGRLMGRHDHEQSSGLCVQSYAIHNAFKIKFTPFESSKICYLADFVGLGPFQ